MSTSMNNQISQRLSEYSHAKPHVRRSWRIPDITVGVLPKPNIETLPRKILKVDINDTELYERKSDHAQCD
jgi:hypothetical protein